MQTIYWSQCFVYLLNRKHYILYIIYLPIQTHSWCRPASPLLISLQFQLMFLYISLLPPLLPPLHSFSTSLILLIHLLLIALPHFLTIQWLPHSFYHLLFPSPTSLLINNLSHYSTPSTHPTLPLPLTHFVHFHTLSLCLLLLYCSPTLPTDTRTPIHQLLLLTHEYHWY